MADLNQNVFNRWKPSIHVMHYKRGVRNVSNNGSCCTVSRIDAVRRIPYPQLTRLLCNATVFQRFAERPLGHPHAIHPRGMCRRRYTILKHCNHVCRLTRMFNAKILLAYHITAGILAVSAIFCLDAIHTSNTNDTVSYPQCMHTSMLLHMKCHPMATNIHVTNDTRSTPSQNVIRLPGETSFTQPPHVRCRARNQRLHSIS